MPFKQLKSFLKILIGVQYDALPAVRPGDSQGGGFSAAPLESASSQCSCRDKNIASGGTKIEAFLKDRSIRIGFHLGTMRASSPTKIPYNAYFLDR